MKTKLQFLTAGLLMMVFNLSAQEINGILGVYEVEVECKRISIYGGESDEEPIAFQLTVEKDVDDASQIQFVFPDGTHNIYWYQPVKATVSEGLNFEIAEQSLGGPMFSTTVSGAGNIKEDSIFIQYTSATSSTTLQCDGKGKKKVWGADVYSLKAKKYNVYVDAVNQVIVLDEALQAQPLTVEIIGLQGNIISQKTTMGESVSIANLPKGVYLFRIFQDGKVIYSDKILK